MQEPEITDDSNSLPRRRTRRSSGAWPHVPPAMIQSPQIDVETLQEHFHLPITEVAKKLGVCATVLKKICRKNGISRWPHRKIKSLDKTIAQLEATKSKNPQQQSKINEELVAARHAKEQLIRNPNGGTPQRSMKSRRVHRPSFRGVDAVSDDSSFDSSDGVEPHSSSSTSDVYHGTLRRHTGRVSSRSSIDDLASPRSHRAPTPSHHSTTSRTSRASSISSVTAPHRAPAAAPSNVSSRSLSVSSGTQNIASISIPAHMMTKGQRGLQTLLTATLEGPAPSARSATPQPPPPLQVPLNMSSLTSSANTTAMTANTPTGTQYPYVFPSLAWPPSSTASAAGADGKPTFNPHMMMPLNYMQYFNYPLGFPGYAQVPPGTPGSFVDQNGVTRIPFFLPPNASMNAALIKQQMQQQMPGAAFLPQHLQMQQLQSSASQQQGPVEAAGGAIVSPKSPTTTGTKGIAAPAGAGGQPTHSSESCFDLMNLAMTASDGMSKDAMDVDQPTESKPTEDNKSPARSSSPASSASTPMTASSSTVEHPSGSLRASTASVFDGSISHASGSTNHINHITINGNKFPVAPFGGEISIAPLPPSDSGNVPAPLKIEAATH